MGRKCEMGKWDDEMLWGMEGRSVREEEIRD